MEPESFRALAQKLDEQAPRMQFDGNNPNNGNHFIKLDVGNEGSRVIYVNVPLFYLNGRESVLNKFLQSVQTWAKEANADELHVMPPESNFGAGSYRVRIWWD
jgi:hypothetical protein